MRPGEIFLNGAIWCIFGSDFVFKKFLNCYILYKNFINYYFYNKNFKSYYFFIEKGIILDTRLLPMG